MSTSPAPTTAPTRALFASLVDDAALFPPARLPMDRALPGHRRHRAAWYADLVGPFLCAAGRADELRDALDDEPVAVTWIARPGSDDPVADLRGALEVAAADDRIDVAGVELPASAARTASGDLDPAGLAARLRTTAPLWLEVDRGGAWRSTVDRLADLTDPVHAKLRTGGTTAEAFPTADEVAAFVGHAASSGVAFKLTAGLHHAIRHTDPDTGFEHHGFLNILCAVDTALDGAGVDDVAAVVDERDPAVLVARVTAFDMAAATAVRGLLRSFGCCDVRDPVGDLVDLGLLERGG